MSLLEIPPSEESCEKCGKCVNIVIYSAPKDFDAPRLETECNVGDCPINRQYDPHDSGTNVVKVSFCADD